MFKQACLSLALCLLTSLGSLAQKDAYIDSLNAYQARYVAEHNVVTGEDRKWLQFFPVSQDYEVRASFEYTDNPKWFSMPTSGTIKKVFRQYGTAKFYIHDTLVTIPIYQSQQLMQTDNFRDHLFLPFTDKTTGQESYETGRYIDLSLKDIQNGTIIIDFNKAYNPYCSYVSGKYNCPIPPADNDMPVAIFAGEKKYARPH